MCQGLAGQSRGHQSPLPSPGTEEPRGGKVAVPPGPNNEVGGTAAALSNVKVVGK